MSTIFFSDSNIFNRVMRWWRYSHPGEFLKAAQMDIKRTLNSKLPKSLLQFFFKIGFKSVRIILNFYLYCMKLNLFFNSKLKKYLKCEYMLNWAVFKNSNLVLVL